MPEDRRGEGVPSLLRAPLVIAGAVVVTVSALLFLGGLFAEIVGLYENPYLGIVFYLLVPVGLVAGLLLMPLGVWLERRRRLRGLPPSLREWPRLDLNRDRVRAVTFGVIALTPVNVMLVAMASYKGVEYMDSVSFCGQVCHEVMEPEFVAHQSGPHAGVRCTACHVGPGPEWYVRSKASGARRAVAAMTGTYARPVPAPVHDMPPARDTCGQCHWASRFHGERIRVVRSYAEDEANTEATTTLRIFAGGIDALGRASGVHWHVAEENAIEYVALDPQRQRIGLVRLVGRPGGPVTEFRAPGVTDEELAAGEVRRMDCLDCHNRPAHAFARSAERAVDELLASGAVSRDLPYIRREALAAVTAEYASQAQALDAIAARLRAFYEREYPGVWAAERAAIEQAAAGLSELYRRNVFPAMRVRWGTYPNHRGHTEFPGCFRCHNDEHAAPDGRVIRQDCDLCHAFE